MLSVELSQLADVLDTAGQGKNISVQARKWSNTISDAIWKDTVGPQSIFFHDCTDYSNRS